MDWKNEQMFTCELNRKTNECSNNELSYQKLGIQKSFDLNCYCKGS